MIFYRSAASSSGVGPALHTLRVIITAALIAYPAGCILLLNSHGQSDGLGAGEIIGFALVGTALLCALPVFGSPLQRVVGDTATSLDEFELQLRHRATSWAYFVITAVLASAVMYLGIASDAGWWRPNRYEHFNALFWGVLLYSSLLPTAFLAWTMTDPDPAD